MEKSNIWDGDPGRKIIIYGAGYQGSRLVNFLTTDPGTRENILCAFDSNPLKHGTRFSGIPIVLPTAEYLKENPLVILAHELETQLELMREVCRKLGYETIDYAEVMGNPRRDAWTFTPDPETDRKFLILGLVDSCNISCTNCTRIFRARENIPENVMSRETYTQILDRAVELGFPHIGFVNWAEPFLHPQVEKFSRMSVERGLKLVISSNLSLPRIPALIPTLEKCAEFMISVSGFTQEMHSRNHRGSDIAVVKKHIEAIADAKRRQEIAADVYVKYLDFGYNSAEIEDFRKYTEELGLGFRTMHGVTRVPFKSDYDTEIRNLFVSMMNEFGEYRKKSLMKHCSYRDLGPAVDYNGDAYLCCTCLNTPFFRVGSFIRDDYTLLRALRQTHPYCAFCGMEWTRAVAAQKAL